MQGAGLRHETLNARSVGSRVISVRFYPQVFECRLVPLFTLNTLIRGRYRTHGFPCKDESSNGRRALTQSDLGVGRQIHVLQVLGKSPVVILIRLGDIAA